MTQAKPGKLVLYASVGPRLTQYDVDAEAATLTEKQTIDVVANVQYVWPHASRDFLYVASSDSAPGMGLAGTNHHVTAFRIEAEDGGLRQHGMPMALPHRPIHMSTDRASEYILVAYNNPAAVQIFRIDPDGTPGAEVVQGTSLDPGVFPHQVLATPDNRQVLLVARGHDAAQLRPEEPGALKQFDFVSGSLSNERSIEPDGGFGFGPRHLDFHPSRPWIYVSLERQNEVALFDLVNGHLAPTPRFRISTLAEPDNIRGHQWVGTVHVHPNGRFVYVANRASSAVDFGGQAVFAGGENSIAVFAIDQATGEPRLIQHADSHGIHPRTFHIDPSGRLMVVAHIVGMNTQDGGTITHVPARLSLFHIGDDGTLAFRRSYDIETSGRFMWWMGMFLI